MPAPDEVIALVERFKEQYDSYRRAVYNETQVRREFVDPLFMALGWDVNNERGHAEAYKEVIHEDSLKIGGQTKAPDYSFRIGPVRKFFLETKKPFVDIGKDTRPAYQLRRYGWSAKLPLCVLTDFEEFAVYDTRVRPTKDDAASTARVLYLRYTEYIERWDEIAGIFSRDAILRGAFDRFAESKTKKRGTAQVDEAFLAEIEGWRALLAAEIAVRNKDLSQREVNAAVQKTIDRIVFLRICEDRGIEDYGRLQALLNGPGVYRRMAQLFERADERYNSGLFHFTKERGRAEPPDEWTLGLTIEDKPLKQILKHLYYPDSPYEFSVLGADILGQVYEQFLGKVIVLTKSHRAKIEEKPEVRKAGGVYYTPTYIVDYIVQQTVGELVKDRHPHEVAGRTKTTFKPAKGQHPVTVLDPACGSGSFLIGAYQFLLDWYLQQYVASGPAGYKDRVYQTRHDEWRLTTAERKRILLDHIYGVDIDSQAVEVTKLSLLLKVLEGENRETLDRQLFHKERALPDLSENIKCGNSLIGPDFYDTRQLELYDEEELYRINAFDWDAEFAEIMGRGGFDAVIGNPPYVRMEGFKPLKDYLRGHYGTHADRSDLYVYFLERALHVLRNGGLLSMIVSNKFLRAKYGIPLRKHLAERSDPVDVVDLAGLPVFRGATVRTIVLTARNNEMSTDGVVYAPPLSSESFMAVETGLLPLNDAVRPVQYVTQTESWRNGQWSFLQREHHCLREKLLSESTSLAEWLDAPICYGVKSGLVDAFIVDASTAKDLSASNSQAANLVKPYLIGREIRAYQPVAGKSFLIYTYHGVDLENCKAILQHLQPFKARLMKRATKQEWYELQQPQYRYVQLMSRPKIVYPDIANECRFSLDVAGHVCGDTSFAIPVDDKALLGLLNSRVAFFYFLTTCAALEGPGEAYLRFKTQYVSKFPIPQSFSRQQQPLTRHVSEILALSESVSHGRTNHARRVVERKIATLTSTIDRLVYELYGLTEDEIRLVEEATG